MRLILSPPAGALVLLLLATCSTEELELAPSRDGDGGVHAVDTQHSLVIQAPTIIASPATGLELTEGSAEPLRVRLSAQPTADVTVFLVSSNQLVASVVAAVLTFTPQSWSTDQLVTVEGTNDANLTDDAVTLTLSAPQLPVITVDATAFDASVQALRPSPSSFGVLQEGSHRTFTVRLTQPPTEAVQVSVTSSNPTALGVDQPTLTFTADNWTIPQTLQATALHDDDLVSTSAAVVLVATGMAIRTLTATIPEDDVQAILATPDPLEMPEGTDRVLAVRLAFRPAADVILDASALEPLLVSVSPSTLIFTPGNYATPQNLTVTAFDDADAVVTNATVRLQEPFGSLSKNVPVGITETDVLAIEVDAASVTVSENGIASFRARLTAMPPLGATITAISNVPNAIRVTSDPLFFDRFFWNVYQTVSIQGIEDFNVVSEAGLIELTSPGIPAAAVAATVADNDTMSIVVAPGTISLPEGGTSSFGVRLAAEPSSSIDVSCTSADLGAVTADPISMRFDSSNWSNNQFVTIVAQDDPDVVHESVAVTCRSAGLANRAVTVLVADNDAMSIVAPSELTVAEETSGAFSISLGAQPSPALDVTCSSSNTALATLRPPSLTFTSTTWNTNQTMFVDTWGDGDLRNDSVALTCRGSGAPDRNISLTIVDNDQQRLRASVSSLTVSEGSSNTLSLSLDFQPLGDTAVALSVVLPGAATVSPTSLTFTPTSYGPRTITVHGTSDSDGVDDGATLKSPRLGSTRLTSTSRSTMMMRLVATGSVLPQRISSLAPRIAAAADRCALAPPLPTPSPSARRCRNASGYSSMSLRSGVL